MDDDVKNQIRDTINESLLEALQNVNKQQKSWSDKALVVAQIILVPLIGWLLLNSVEIQKDIVLLRAQVTQVNEHLAEHMVAIDQGKLKNTVLHHRKLIRDCTACHNNN